MPPRRPRGLGAHRAGTDPPGVFRRGRASIRFAHGGFTYGGFTYGGFTYGGFAYGAVVHIPPAVGRDARITRERHAEIGRHECVDRAVAART